MFLTKMFSSLRTLGNMTKHDKQKFALTCKIGNFEATYSYPYKTVFLYNLRPNTDGFGATVP